MSLGKLQGMQVNLDSVFLSLKKSFSQYKLKSAEGSSTDRTGLCSVECFGNSVR